MDVDALRLRQVEVAGPDPNPLPALLQLPAGHRAQLAAVQVDWSLVCPQVQAMSSDLDMGTDLDMDILKLPVPLPQPHRLAASSIHWA